MNIDQNLTLDQILAMEIQLEQKKSELAAHQRPVDLIKCKKIISLHSFTASELGFPLSEAGRIAGAKQKKFPVKYYDPITKVYWTGNGSPKVAFMQNYIDKKMDQYLISTDYGQQLSIELKKDVKVISGEIFEYKEPII